MTLFGKRVFCKCSEVKGLRTGSPWSQAGPESMPSVLTGDREKKTRREEEAEGGGTRPQGPPRLEPPKARRGGKNPPDPRRECGPADPVISGFRPPGCGTIRVCGCSARVCGHLSERPGDALGATPNCRFLGPCSRLRGEAQESAPSPRHHALLPSDHRVQACMSRHARRLSPHRGSPHFHTPASS